ncbi:questin oxidase family protein [Actinoplanes bogorensis]|uniref:Questin oxidase family protein n=1 Tax=Paractinoplanes bogorensis TaxID=1610840 RepID=A0ABS5YW25_9ACTN|nr:questin oxidase family protein [Actinoplanes bogorensis]MBU2667281.1 questin oxidase family protein [Actinoplanes bogorensis]
MSDDELNEAYVRMHHAGPEWGEDRLTNHGPMAVEVLVRRGHADRVPRWVDRYLPRLDDLPRATTTITDDSWPEALGDERRIAEWTDYFGRQVRERPWRDVLELWWPRLLPGILAGTTHGVIRVGHAVRALLRSGGSVTELAHGLALWASRFQALPGSGSPAGRLDVATALRRVPAVNVQDGPVAARLARLAGTPGWTEATAALRAPTTPLEARDALAQLVAAGTVQYLHHGHASPIILVHGATAPNAVLHCLPALPQDLWRPSFDAMWATTSALTAAYAGQPAFMTRDETVDAASVFERAADHGDEHVIKFTDTALEVWERTGDPAALAAAAHITTLVRPPSNGKETFV